MNPDFRAVFIALAILIVLFGAGIVFEVALLREPPIFTVIHIDIKNQNTITMTAMPDSAKSASHVGLG
jgi:hypothetical protein